MADENIVVGITANSNFSDLVTDINKVTASLARMQQTLVTTDKSFTNQVAKLNAAFSASLSSSGQFSTHFVSLQSEAEKFGRSLDSGKLKLRDYFGTLNTHIKTNGGLIRDLAKQQTALQNAVIQPLGKNAQGLMQYNIHVARGLDEVANKTKIAAQQAAIMNKVVQQGANQLINWGKNTQWAGRQLTVGLTVPMLAFGKAAADAFKQADMELTRLTKVYGDIAGTSATELSKIRKEVTTTARELSASYGASFKETLALSADIAATGKVGQELLGSVTETTRLAILGEVDRAEAMKATLAIQSAFNQNTAELADSINFLNAVENQTSTSLADLVEAIPKAGPVVKGLGGDIKDLALYLTAMREGGINASEGANAIKSSLASLINPTGVAIDKFKSFGIDLLGIVNNNAGNITQTLLDLQGSLEKLDPLQKSQAIEQLFGKFQFARLSALFENLGKEGSQTLQVLDLMKASSQDLANVASRELTQVTESASGRYRRALEALKADLAGVGEQFLNINTNLIKFVDTIVKFATNLPGPIKSILAFFGGITAIAGPLIMLTGVLGNFFGYIIKGVSHFRALFKGAEGWRMLTPEILAANKAGNLMEKTFYNDAAAATVLKNAISNLVNELSVLESKANTGVYSAGEGFGGAAAAAMQQRVVNKNHPLVGAPYSRASAHMVPRGQMTNEQRAAQTFFGMVPSSIPVNQRIGENPMIYSEGNLPNYPGVTTVQTAKGTVSTGVVAAEAAKHHSMNAALAMMSKTELAELKKNIMQTGVATQKFMDVFDDILPAVTSLTSNAAQESAQIVAKLRAGQLNVEAARAEIVALNLRTEAALGATATSYAAGAGRQIDLQRVPTLNQPIVDASGKSNMRELFKKSGSRNFINKLAGLLGVRTSGAGYNIETTMPKRYNMGGYVFTANDGNIVPGPNVNADVVPAMLTPGEFVVNAKSTAQNLPLLQAINGGTGEEGINYNKGGMIERVTQSLMQLFGRASSSPTSPQRGHVAPHEQSLLMWLTRRVNQNTRSNSLVGMSGIEIAEDLELLRNQGLHPMDLIHESALKLGYGFTGVDKDTLYEKVLSELKDPERAGSVVFGGPGNPSLEQAISETLRPDLQNLRNPSSQFGNYYDEVTDLFTDRASGSRPGRSAGFGSRSGRSISSLPRGLKSILSTATGGSKSSRIRFSLSNLSPRSKMLPIFRNAGGMVPGYNRGGRIQAFTKGMIMKKLGSSFGKSVNGGGYGQGHSFSHLSAQIGMGKKLFGHTGLRPHTQNLLYDALLETVGQTMPNGYYKAPDGKLIRGIEPNQTDQMLRDAAEIVARRHGKQLSPIDKKILQEQFRHMDLKSVKYAPGIQKKIFGANAGGKVMGFNRGGMVPGYIGGGKVKGYQGGGIVRNMIAPMVLGSAGYSLGSSLGGNIGGETGSMIGGMAGSMVGSMGPMMMMGRRSADAAEGVSKFATITSKLPGVLKGTLMGVSRLNIAVAAVTTTAILGYKAFKNYQEGQKLQALSFGLTADSAEKAGLKFTDYNKSIKNAIADSKAMKERNQLLYESMTQSNTPLKMTIEQYKKLRTEVKSTMAEYIKMFNRTDTGNVKEIAAQLKAQFMAAGDAAEEASAKIYAVIEQSNKAGQAFSAVSSTAFRSIKAPQEAALATAETFAKAMMTNNRKGQADSLLTAFQGIDTAIADSVSKNAEAVKKNKAEVISLAKITEDQMNKINSGRAGQVTLSQQLISEIKKQNPELAKILNSTDTLTSSWAKYQLVLKGVSLDVSKLSGEAAKAALEIANTIQASIDLSTRNSLLKSQYAKFDELNARIKKLTAATKGQSAADQISDKKKVKSLNEQIALINKQADDKIKALKKVQDAENAELDIQRARLEYQQAIARGDRDAAAQAQMRIQQVVSERQTSSAEESILANAASAIAPLQAQIDAISDKQEKMGDAAALAGDSLGRLQGESDTLGNNLSGVNKLLTDILTNRKLDPNYKGSPEEAAAIAAAKSGLKSLGIKGIDDPKAPNTKDATVLSFFKDTVNRITSQTVGIEKILSDLGKEAVIKAQTVNLYASAINNKVAMTPSANPVRFPSESSIAIKDLPKGTKIRPGETFTLGDKTYAISGPGRNGRVPVTPKELGGPVKSNSMYLVGEKGPELFVPSFNGTIIPNHNLEGSFNVPGSSINMKGSPSSSSGVYNNAYNVKIELNGTNLSADEVYNKFEQKLAMLNAKQGRDKMIGGGR